MSDANAGSPSAAATATAGDGTLNLTPREQEILSKAIMCLKSPPEVDYVRLADACGMSNHRSASNAWSGIKKKLTEHGALPTPVKKTPVKRKAAEVKSEGNENDNNNDAKETPTKKSRATKAIAAKKDKGPATPKTPKKGRDKAVKTEAKDESDSDAGLGDVPMLEETVYPAGPADAGVV